MTSKQTRILSFVLALSMILSAVGMILPRQAAIATEETTAPAETTATEETTMPELTLNVSTDAVISEAGQTVYFTFTPAESGIYVFSSDATVDTYGYLYDGDMNLLVEDDDSGNGNNFSVSNYLDAGVTYIFGARYYSYSNTGTFPVRLKMSTSIVGITADPISIVEGTCGYWRSNVQADHSVVPTYFQYTYLPEDAAYDVTFSDGTFLTVSGSSFTYDDVAYDVYFDGEQSETAPWTAGNSYPCTISVGDVSASTFVTIVEDSIDYVTVDPISVAKDVHGYYSWDSEGQEYFQYNWLDHAAYTVTMTDGTTVTGSGPSFEYDGETYWMTNTDSQSYADRHWEPGNTYAEYVMLGAAVAQAEITVVGSPIESISIEPVSLKAYHNGYDAQEEIDGETVSYFCYNTWNLDLSYTVTFVDGTVTTATGPNVFYNGSDHSIEIQDNQSYQNQWLPGNTYTVNASVLGAQCTVDITIEEIPIESIAVQPITMYGDLDALSRTDYDENGEECQYNLYCWWEKLRTVVTFRDGTTQEVEGTGFYYDGVDYYMNYTEGQSADNPWQPGNTYTETMSVLGITAPITVTVTPPVVEKVVADPVILTEGIHGYWLGTNHAETRELIEYYHYDWENYATYTIYFTTGETLRCQGTSFEFDGKTHNLGWTDTQNPDHWVAGNTYDNALVLNGLRIPFTVTIQKTPVVSVEVAPVHVNEGVHGEYRTATNASGESVTYFFYQWWEYMSYKITFEDGTVVESTGMGFDYKGEHYSLQVDINQSADEFWTMGNSYATGINVMCVPADVTVVVEENPVERITVDPIYLENEAGGYWKYGYDASGSYTRFYYYRWWNQLTYTIHFKDGTTQRCSGTRFSYDDIGCTVSYTDSQNASNPMLAGNTYLLSLRILGVETEVEVSVSTTVTEDRYEYMLTGSGAVITNVTNVLDGEVMELPDTLGGYPVIGITSLGIAMDHASEICIPDSVTMLSADVFNCWGTPLRKLHLGSGVSYIGMDMFTSAEKLEYISVSEDNPYYCSVEGVVYDKAVTTLVVYPLGKTDSHKVPDTVTDVSSLMDNASLYANLSVELGAGVEDYVTVDGVTYSADMTKVYFCSKDKTGAYVMPDSVTQIERCAFTNTNLTEITVSANVTQIVYGAFYGSEKLQTVNLPDKLESIGMFAFQYCSSLESASIPASVKSICSNAYYGCEALDAVYITDLTAWTQIEFWDRPANPLSYARNLYLNQQLVTELQLPETGLTSISSYAFCNGSMTSAVIPGNITSVGSYAFCNSDLQTVELSEGITEIWYRAFEGTDLTAVTLPDSLTTLDSSVFSGCTNLQSVTIGSGLTEIGSSAFCNTALQTVTIPENVTYIGWGAFRGSKLTQVIIENDAVEIGGSAFFNCPLKDINLGSGVSVIDEGAFCGSHAVTVRIPDSVTNITYRSFAFSPNLMGVVIPEGVEHIDSCAFEGDLNMSHVFYGGTADQWNEMYVESPELLHATLHCGAAGDEFTVTRTCAQIKFYCAICQRTEWINRVDPAHEFVDGVCTICGHEGYWEYEIDTTSKTVTVTGYSGPDTAISIPSSIRNMPVTAIAESAFYARKDLTAITIPSTVTTIGSKAFAQCEGLTKITIPDSVTELGSYAFAYCYYLTDVTLSDNLTAINERTFYRCGRLGDLRIGAAVTAIGESVFEGCWNLERVIFTGNAPEIDENAFLNLYTTCDYPAANATWTEEVLLDYGGSITWNPVQIIPPVLTGKSFTLSFEEEILVNFYFQIDDTANVDEIGMAVFYTDPGSEIDIASADECYQNAVYDPVKDRYMCQTDGIAAKTMGETRCYVAYAKLTDGTYAYSSAYEYSPRKYATNILSKASSTAKLKQLCVAMLNYGAAAQEYFGYNADDLMNSALTDEQRATVTAYDAALFTGPVAADPAKTGSFAATATGFAKKTATVSFEGSFAINYYFTPNETIDGTMTFYYWTAEDYAAAEKLSPSNATGTFAATAQENGAYWAQIDGIAAKELDKTYYVAAVYYSELELRCTGVIAYSLSKYCMNNAKEGKDMQNLAANTAMYGYYAKEYFA